MLAALPTVVLLAAAAGIGYAVRRRDHEARQFAATAAAAERRRIARDLHDLVGHAVGLMVVQAGTGRLALDRGDAATAEQALRSVERAGREALSELRLLLGLLRADDDATGLAPQPGLEAIGALVEQLAEQGHQVRLTSEVERSDVPASVALSAYRIVQEALTNLAKHTDRAPAEVCLRHADGTLEVEIVDEGTARDGPSRPGYGLVGMRERVALHGGELDSGFRPGGGYAVRARLPLNAP
jgi:signal transduction histidine kinase